MNPADHQQIRLLLAHYRELTDSERAHVEAHLAGCADCRTVRAAYQQQNLALRTLPSRAPTTRLYHHLTDEIARQQAPRPWYQRLSAELAFVAVAAVLLFAFLSAIRLQGLPQETAAYTATPLAEVAGVSGTVQPSITPTQTASVTVGITTTTPLTPVTSLPGHALTDTLPWVNYAVARPSGMELLTARANGAQASRSPALVAGSTAAPQVSPDGQWTAVASNGVTLLPNNGDAAITLVTPDDLRGEVRALAWAPDSTALAMALRRPDGSYQVSTVRLQAGLPMESFGFERGYPRLLGWDANSQQVVILLSADEATDSSGQIQILAPGQEPLVQPYSYAAAPSWRLRQATLGPRGRWVYYLADQPNRGSILVRQSLRDGSQTVALSATLPIDSYVLADDENLVAYTLTTASGSPAARSNVRLLAFSVGTPQLLSEFAGSPAALLAWSPSVTTPLQSWIVLSQPTETGQGQRVTLLRPSDGISLPVTIDGLEDTPAGGLHVVGWSSPMPATDQAADGSNFDAATRAVGQALAKQQWPALTRWLTPGTFTYCTYPQTCSTTTSTTDALMTLVAAFRAADVRTEPERQVLELPNFSPPGEAVLLVRRSAPGDVDSSHLYWQRAEDGQWQIVGILTGIPYYGAPRLADVRATPAAFAGLEVVLEGEYFAATLPPDLPPDAPRLGQWVLRDASGAALWVRNATPDVGQGIADGAWVQVLGELKVEQGWPFVQVSLVRPLAVDGGS